VKWFERTLDSDWFLILYCTIIGIIVAFLLYTMAAPN
jgi:hypothetical protein